MDDRRNVFLAIDDRQENLISLMALIHESFPTAEVLTALDGETGLEIAARRVPDIIILDIMMPGMDGYEVCRRMKGNPILADIPVIFLTALKSDRQVRLKALDSGGEAFICKPLDEVELYVTIRGMLKIRSFNLQNKARIENLQMDLRNKEDELSDSLQRFQLMIENISDVVGITDRDGVVRYRSPNNELVFGVKPEQVVGKSAFEFVHPDDQLRLGERFRLLLDSPDGFEQTDEFRYLRGDGSVLWVQIAGKNMLNHKLINGILLSYKDISARKEAEQTIKAEAERYRTVVESTSDMIWVVDPVDFGLLTYNSSLERYFKTNRNIEIKPGMTPDDLLPEGFQEIWYEMYRAALANGPFTKEYETVAGMRFLKLTFYPLQVAGEIIGISVFGQDISAMKRYEMVLKEDSERYHALIESTQHMIWVVEPKDFRLNFFNSSYADFHKRNAGIVVREGMGPEELGSEEQSEAWKDLYKRAVYEGRYKINHQSQVYGTESILSIAPLNIDGHVVGVSVFAEDITEEARNKRELEVSNKKLEHRLQQSINAISKIGELRDMYTAGHQWKVQQLACAIARKMGLPEPTVQNISYGALIHDIGKIYIASDILNKPGKISALEYQILQTHVIHGYEVAQELDFPPAVPTMVYQHHECLDGSGYPQGLIGDQILLESRILAVADVVEAISSHRPYRASLGTETALDEINRYRGIKYDGVVVDICTGLFRDEGFEFTNPD